MWWGAGGFEANSDEEGMIVGFFQSFINKPPPFLCPNIQYSLFRKFLRTKEKITAQRAFISNMHYADIPRVSLLQSLVSTVV
jgi:hypothetical protein